MNYFAHGHRFVEQPYVLAGTALPDWLNAADRGVRLRHDRVRPGGDLARGVAQHFADDDWFHRSPAFQRTEGDVSRLLREADGDPRLRAWFLGHVLVEMLVDAHLIRRRPDRLDAYYAALDAVDARRVEREARPWLTGRTDRLVGYIDAFREWRYLYSYVDDEECFARLRGVARRVGLPPLPDTLGRAVPAARRLVEERADALLAPPVG